MEVVKLATVAVLASLATPAAAVTCMEAVPALETMEKNGYHITFGDIEGEWIVMMAEDVKGGWVMFALKDNALCPIASGSSGFRVPFPPNV